MDTISSPLKWLGITKQTFGEAYREHHSNELGQNFRQAGDTPSDEAEAKAKKDADEKKKRDNKQMMLQELRFQMGAHFAADFAFRGQSRGSNGRIRQVALRSGNATNRAAASRRNERDQDEHDETTGAYALMSTDIAPPSFLDAESAAHLRRWIESVVEARVLAFIPFIKAGMAEGVYSKTATLLERCNAAIETIARDRSDGDWWKRGEAREEA